MKKYCAPNIDDIDNNDISLDEEMNNSQDEDSGFTLKDKIPANKELYNNYIPDYDVKDQDGQNIGWKIDTFASIVNKGRSTLQRWDRNGFLKAKRYKVGRSMYKQKYRLYTREDIDKVKEIQKLMDEKMKHKA